MMGVCSGRQDPGQTCSIYIRVTERVQSQGVASAEIQKAESDIDDSICRACKPSSAFHQLNEVSQTHRIVDQNWVAQILTNITTIH